MYIYIYIYKGKILFLDYILVLTMQRGSAISF